MVIITLYEENMGFRLGKRSLQRLTGVHPDLLKVVNMAIRISKQDFSVIEGMRTLETQKDYVKRGVSETMNSRHLTGHAVDLYPYPIHGDVDDIPSEQWNLIADAMHAASEHYGILCHWGHDLWGWDKPHYQLDWTRYPKGVQHNEH
jgi:peptidoglycan L-alanyl-D-glutamate endopeptidase CwlK